MWVSFPAHPPSRSTHGCPPPREARGLREARRERARAAEALAGALQHHAEVPRRRPLEAREAAAALGGARGVARARGLDYVLQVGGARGRGGVGGRMGRDCIGLERVWGF